MSLWGWKIGMWPNAAQKITQEEEQTAKPCQIWEVLNGVGVDGVGVLSPFFLRIFPFFSTHFSPFSSHFSPFSSHFSLLLLNLGQEGKQQQFTAKMGNFTPTPSAPTPCTNNHVKLVHRGEPKRREFGTKVTPREAHDTQSAINLWGRSGRGHCRKFSANFRKISANFPQNFRTLSWRNQISVASPAEPRGEKNFFVVLILGGEKLSKFVEKCRWKTFKRPERG